MQGLRQDSLYNFLGIWIPFLFHNVNLLKKAFLGKSFFNSSKPSAISDSSFPLSTMNPRGTPPAGEAHISLKKLVIRLIQCSSRIYEHLWKVQCNICDWKSCKKTHALQTYRMIVACVTTCLSTKANWTDTYTLNMQLECNFLDYYKSKYESHLKRHIRYKHTNWV